MHRSAFYSSLEPSSQSCHFPLEHREVRDQIGLVLPCAKRQHSTLHILQNGSWLDPDYDYSDAGQKDYLKKLPFLKSLNSILKIFFFY